MDGVRAEIIRQLASTPASLAQSTPLWEDRLLRGVHLLGTRHQHMDWSDPLRQGLTAAEEVGGEGGLMGGHTGGVRSGGGVKRW